MKLVDKKASMEVAQVMPRTYWLYRARSTRSEILVITILLLGLLLRIHGLDTESLWIDEGTSVQLARSSLTHVIENRSHSVNPPLYFIILHYWIRLFGESEFSLRLPSAIFGSLALIAIYRVGDLIFGKRVGTLSCFLLAISMFHIGYSQEARGYSLMALMTLVSMYFFVKLLGRMSFVFLIGYVFSSAILMYTHFYGLLIVLVQNIFFISVSIFSNAECELDFKRWILTQGMLAILYTPWVGFLTGQIAGIQEGFWIPTPTISTIIETLLAYSAKSKPLLLCFLALSFLAILAPKRTAGKPNWKTGSESIDGCSRSLNLSNAAKICLLVLWLAVPVALPFVASQISTPIYYTRYTIAASLAFYILIARGIQEIPNRYFKPFVVISIITYSLLSINRYYAETNKQQWRELADYVHENAETGDLMLFNAGGIKDSAFAYYFKRDDLIQKPLDLDIDPVTEKTRFDRRKDIDSLEPIVRGYNRVWLVLAHSNDNQGLIRNELSRLYYLSYYHRYVGIELYLFEKSQQLVTQEIRYHVPEAGKVILAWGVNGWATIPEAHWPTGTVVKDGLTRTSMVRQDNTFVAKVQVPAGATIDYVFHITEMHSGAAIDVWDTNSNEDYHTTATQDGILEVQTTLTLAQDQAPASAADVPLVTQEIRYHMPEAEEVFLLWGVNGWAAVPEDIRPAGTMVKDRVMYTPMVHEGDTFIANVWVPAGATMDYGFLITRTHSGRDVEVWEANGEQDFHTIAEQDGFIEVKTKMALAKDQTAARTLDAGLPLLISIGIVFIIGITFTVQRVPALLSLKTRLHEQQLTYLRDLLRELVVRDMKLRYKRSVLGIVWSLLNPLFQMLVFMFLSRRVFSLEIRNYPSFVFTGVLAWNWFQSTVVTMTSAITGNRELIRRPGFPVAILPVVTVTTNLIHFLLALPVPLLFLLLGGGRLTPTLLALPIVIGLQFLLILGLGYLAATANVTFRDTQHLLVVFFMLLFYLTPVFYDANAVPARYQMLYRLNPMFHLITAYRAILIGGELPDFRALLPLAALVGVLLWLGHSIFQRASYHFVEEL